MLPGIARKVAIPFILLSITGWILFGVGFGIRNFYYRTAFEQYSGDLLTSVNEFFGKPVTIPLLDNAAKPEFFMFWMFAGGGLVVYILSFVMVFWEHAISKFLVNIFLPVFLLGAGTVLFVDGLLIYRYYQEQQNNGVGLLCSDIYQILGFTTVNANENDKYASIEFAGVLVSVLFYWIFLMISSFFVSTKYTVYK